MGQTRRKCKHSRERKFIYRKVIKDQLVNCQMIWIVDKSTKNNFIWNTISLCFLWEVLELNSVNEDFSVDRINCLHPAILRLLQDSKAQSIRIACPGASNIQLTMREDLSPEPNSHFLQSLSLRFVDCCSKSCPDRELSP